jgi:hypothetical protein
MITTIEDTSPEVLTGRIINGLDFCNSTWQKMRASTSEAEYHRLDGLLSAGVIRLRELIRVAQLYGLDKCVFGQCKFDEDKYFCFGCTKNENETLNNGR